MGSIWVLRLFCEGGRGLLSRGFGHRGLLSGRLLSGGALIWGGAYVLHPRTTHTHTKLIYYSGAAEGKEKWGSNTHPWRAREPEPIIGVLGRSPQRGPGGRAPGGG